MFVLSPCIPLQIKEKELLGVVSKAKDWAIMHGAAMRSKTNYSTESIQFAPFILIPTSFPRKEFEKAVKLQTILNELMHWVANDDDFLRETLKATINVDEFTNNLFKIYEEILKEGPAQAPLFLGLFRSDYMVNKIEENIIKQVEFNTMSCSFGGISTYLKPMHSYILQELGHGDKEKNLPENNALPGLCSGLITAWKMLNNPKAIMLFIVENISYNICDQRFHEFEIRRTNPEIKIIRKTLTEVHSECSLGPNKELYIDGFEVSVVYFRAAYEPDHYPSQNEWDARLLLEKSRAVKCPAINYHLAGTKKVQQALARTGMLKRFINDDEKIKLISEIFTGLYSLDNDEHGDAAVEMALKNPEKYVLKPQREGGGNNIYGSDIPEALSKLTRNERSAWILMERIFPPITKGYAVRPYGETPPPLVDLVSELGIFGVIIGDKEKILVNQQVGHMLRTKEATANEGGVAAGHGALDSPYLVD